MLGKSLTRIILYHTAFLIQNHYLYALKVKHCKLQKSVL